MTTLGRIASVIVADASLMFPMGPAAARAPLLASWPSIGVSRTTMIPIGQSGADP